MTRLTIADVIRHVEKTKGWRLRQNSVREESLIRRRFGKRWICPTESLSATLPDVVLYGVNVKRTWDAADNRGEYALRARLLKAAGLEEKP